MKLIICILAITISVGCTRKKEDGKPLSLAQKYFGEINNNFNLTTEEIESDPILSAIHNGAVKEIETKFPRYSFKKNRPYSFWKKNEIYELGYRPVFEDLNRKHNYIVIEYHPNKKEYVVRPTR